MGGGDGGGRGLYSRMPPGGLGLGHQIIWNTSIFKQKLPGSIKPVRSN